MLPLANIIVYGLSDALNPCNLSTMIIAVIFLGWLRQKGIAHVSLAWVFVGVSYVAVLAYALGGFMSVLYSVSFFNSMRVLYFVIGVLFCIAGLIHFFDWIKVRQGKASEVLLPLSKGYSAEAKPLAQLLGRSSVITLAAVLNAASTVWPMNKYIGFYANFLGMPGEVMSAFLMLAIYCLMLVLPLAVVPLWMSWTSPSGWVSMKPSQGKIVLSAFILGVGINLIYVFH